jgi:uncharacterized Zn-finger protein
MHALSFNCEICNRAFGSEEALEQHLRDSPVHTISFNCETCDRAFNNEEALEQHLRDSPIHALVFDCEICHRSFSSEEALKHHLRDSPVHAVSFNCETCDRAFSSEEALEQHLRDSPIHALSFDCETCNRSFSSEEALEQHLKYSRFHETAQTPLDIFFGSFRSFDYDPSLPPATSYAYLRRQEGWQRGDTAAKDAWDRYQEALEGELRMWYGEENDLTAWHALCRAIGIDPLPQTCGQCEEVRNYHAIRCTLILT